MIYISCGWFLWGLLIIKVIGFDIIRSVYDKSSSIQEKKTNKSWWKSPTRNIIISNLLPQSVGKSVGNRETRKLTSFSWREYVELTNGRRKKNETIYNEHPIRRLYFKMNPNIQHVIFKLESINLWKWISMFIRRISINFRRFLSFLFFLLSRLDRREYFQIALWQAGRQAGR